MKSLLLPMLIFALTARTLSQIHTETVEYKIADRTYEGYLAYNSHLTTHRPGVLVFHEWWGLTPYIKHRVEELAQLGYVAFAPDLYGNGQVVTTPEDAQKLAGMFYGNRELFRSRGGFGLGLLK